MNPRISIIPRFSSLYPSIIYDPVMVVMMEANRHVIYCIIVLLKALEFRGHNIAFVILSLFPTFAFSLIRKTTISVKKIEQFSLINSASKCTTILKCILILLLLHFLHTSLTTSYFIFPFKRCFSSFAVKKLFRKNCIFKLELSLLVPEKI